MGNTIFNILLKLPNAKEIITNAIPKTTFDESAWEEISATLNTTIFVKEGEDELISYKNSKNPVISELAFEIEDNKVRILYRAEDAFLLVESIVS